MAVTRAALLLLACTAVAHANEAERLCRTTIPLQGHAPVAELRGAESYGSDRAAEPFVRAIMQGAAAWYGLRDVDATRQSIAALRAWADAHAMERIVEVGAARSNTNSIYSLRRALVGLLASWSVLDVAATSEDRVAVTTWLARLVALQDTETGARAGRGHSGAVSNRNNHAYLRATVDALWAVRTQDRGRAARAADVVRHAVEDEMRPDGSLRLETARGARALWYQRHAIASLVTIGEVLAPLGFDVWVPRADGRSLHDAIGFLVAGVRDPALVAPYAAEDRNPRRGSRAEDQDLGFLFVRGNGRHYMAWAEYYLRRFPDHPNARPLAAMIRPSLDAARPMTDEIAGGNTSCRVLRG